MNQSFFNKLPKSIATLKRRLSATIFIFLLTVIFPFLLVYKTLCALGILDDRSNITTEEWNQIVDDLALIEENPHAFY